MYIKITIAVTMITIGACFIRPEAPAPVNATHGQDSIATYEYNNKLSDNSAE